MNFRFLLATAVLVKLLVSCFVELGNDEVYYVTYARYPAWSHFDHPPMIGWVLQLFTLNLTFTHDLALRLGMVILGAGSLYFLYRIGSSVMNQKAGVLTALLGATSVYTGIIAGMFVMPDVPQMFFWTAALFTFINALTDVPRTNRWLFFTGLAMAGAMASKYHSVFLVAGLFAFVVFNRPDLLKKGMLWAMFLMAGLGLLPTLIWNVGNDFVSFSFHSERVLPESWLPNFETFGMEILGQFLYQNPVIFVVLLFAVGNMVRQRKHLPPATRLLLWVAVPLYLVFTGFALYRRTLPHWTGPAFVSLLPLAAAYVTARSTKFYQRVAWGTTAFGYLVVALGALQIQTGFITLDPIHRDPHNLMKDDATLDMYGWKQAAEAIAQHVGKGNDVVLLANGWFPTAHVDHYISRPLGFRTLALGKPEQIHKFWWINSTVPTMPNQRFIYYTDSRNYKHPADAIACDAGIGRCDTLWLSRGGTSSKAIFLFEIENFTTDCFSSQ